MNRIIAFAIGLLTFFGTHADRYVQRSMLDTFTLFASIDSQSSYDSVCTAGQHDIHSTREYADLQEMEEAYNLMVEIIKGVTTINSAI